MPDRCLPNKTGFAFSDDPPQYVHCTGGMFVLIPDNKVTSPRNRDGTHRKPASGTYLDYIAFQRRRSDSVNTTLSDTSPDHQFEDSRVGFLWAWNYMLNKRWRTNNTGDENFQDQILADFRAFCSNNDGRLKNYWNCCHQGEHQLNNERDALDIWDQWFLLIFSKDKFSSAIIGFSQVSEDFMYGIDVWYGPGDRVIWICLCIWKHGHLISKWKGISEFSLNGMENWTKLNAFWPERIPTAAIIMIYKIFKI